MKKEELLRFTCPKCKIRLVVDDCIAGTTGPCPSCGAEITAPAMNEEPVVANNLAVEPPKSEESSLENQESNAFKIDSNKDESSNFSSMLTKLIILAILVLLIVSVVYFFVKKGQ